MVLEEKVSRVVNEPMAGIVTDLYGVVVRGAGQAPTRLEDVADIDPRAAVDLPCGRNPSRRGTPIGSATGFKVIADDPQGWSPRRKVLEIEVEVVGRGRTMDGPGIEGSAAAS